MAENFHASALCRLRERACVEVFIYRDLKPRDFREVFVECATIVGGILLILGVALGFTNYLVDAEVPSHLIDWVQSHVQSKYLFLLLLNAALLVVGALMDIFAAILVVVPLLKPLAAAYSIDPVQMGVIFIANLELGFPADARDYGIGNQILSDLGLTTIRILTNNPKKLIGIDGFGLTVVEQVPIEVSPNDENSRYLRVKRDKLGHRLHHQDLKNLYYEPEGE